MRARATRRLLFLLLCANFVCSSITEIFNILRNSIWPPYAIWDLLGKSSDHPWRPIDTWWQTHVKISSWLAYECWQCLNFLSFRLESPIHGPIISVFWGLTPKFREHHLQPKRRIFAQNYAFWTVFGPDRTCRVVALCVYIRPFPIGENLGKIGGSKLPYDTPQENATSPLDLRL